MTARAACRIFTVGLASLSVGALPAAPASAAPKRTFCAKVGAEVNLPTYAIYAYSPTKCATAKSIALDYLRLGQGKPMTRDRYRCTTRKGGSVADGTFGQVSCTRKGKLAIRAYYLGA